MCEEYTLCDDCHIRLYPTIHKSYILYKDDEPEQLVWCKECYMLWINKAINCGWKCDDYVEEKSNK